MFVCFLSDDTHFKTNPKIPGIDLNSVRKLFETLSKPAFSGLLEQVLNNSVFITVCLQQNYKMNVFSFFFNSQTPFPIFQRHQHVVLVYDASCCCLTFLIRPQAELEKDKCCESK